MAPDRVAGEAVTFSLVKPTVAGESFEVIVIDQGVLAIMAERELLHEILNLNTFGGDQVDSRLGHSPGTSAERE